MGCKACGQAHGTLSAPRSIQGAPLTAAEIRSRMPRKPARRPYRQLNGAPRRAQQEA